MKMEALKTELIEAMAKSDYSHKKPVFGLGPLNAKIALIGEAPGGEEEKFGEPFVGKAGKNLSEFLSIIGLTRSDIYITNVVKIRPTKISPKTGGDLNRSPNSKEVAFFTPFLHRELEIIAPNYIVTLGNVPLRAVSGQSLKIGDCHGTILKGCAYKSVFALYHPAAVIYNRSLKEVYLNDLEILRDEIENGGRLK